MDIPHFVFTCSSVDEHLGCFHLLAIMNNAAMNICVHIFVQMYVFNYPGYRPKSEIGGPYGSSIVSYLRSCQPVFSSGHTISHSYQQYMRVLISLHPQEQVTLLFLVGVKWYPFVVLIRISLIVIDVKQLFVYSLTFLSLLWGNVYSNCLPILKLGHFSFTALKSSFCVLDSSSFSRMSDLQVFYHVLQVVFSLPCWCPLKHKFF